MAKKIEHIGILVKDFEASIQKYTSLLVVDFVPQDRRIFPSLTVLENLNLSIYGKFEQGWELDGIYQSLPIFKERIKHKGGPGRYGCPPDVC